MRLTCPNCDAQYEVPDEVIPDEGRDVQCSNCGDTWFQANHETPELASDPATQPPEDNFDTSGSLATAPTSPTDNEEDYDPELKQPAQQQEITSAASDILREEAERETQLRAAETAEPLESQPDLGLDNMPSDDSAHRAREARDRMARIRGEEPTQPEGVTVSGSRRGLLPDIEEINSTLRNTDGDQSSTALGPVHEGQPQKKRGGFARGFALILLIGVGLGLVYTKAPNIGQAIPQAEPMLSSYVGLVDQTRVWIDSRLGEYVTK